MAGTLLGLLLLFILLTIAVFILTVIFWIVMLIDSIQRKYKDSNDKVVWVLVIIFTGIIGALIYYFVVKRK
jgi:TctA family transporter